MRISYYQKLPAWNIERVHVSSAPEEKKIKYKLNNSEILWSLGDRGDFLTHVPHTFLSEIFVE
jgi:hypothetical protein